MGSWISIRCLEEVLYPSKQRDHVAKLAFPNNKNAPAHIYQCFGMRPVPRLCPRNFRFPVLHIGCRDSTGRASFMIVPKASVNEQRGLVTRKRNVGFPRQLRIVQPKPITSHM